MYLQHDDTRIAFLDDYRNYTNKPPEMEGKIINYIGQPYRDFITPHMERLSALFDKAEKERAEVSDEYGNNVFITQWFEGKPIRIQLGYDSAIFKEMYKFFVSKFEGHELNELTITRNCVTVLPSAGADSNIDFTSGRDWLSELWHIDAFGPYAFKIGIYLTDVDDSSGPYEHIKNPEQHFFAEYDFTKYSTRFRELINPEGVKIFGKAHDTFIFHPAVIHKGNYARTKHRDAIMVGFDYIKKIPENINRQNKK